MYHKYGCVLDAHPILPNLWLGSITTTSKAIFFSGQNIKHVLSILKQPPGLPEGFIHTVIPLEDHSTEPLIDVLDTTFNFIEEALATGGGIYVHCMAGVSRSASVVVAYIMKKKQLSVDDAINFVQSKREIINPNPGFLKQLKLYQELGWTIEGIKLDGFESVYQKFETEGKFN